MLKAAIYARFSSDQQRAESITAQVRAIEDYCKHKGYALVAVYTDEAKSATNDQRPEFQRMIKDATEHKFDIAVVHKLDRFARDRYDSAMYRRELKKAGVRLESVLEQLDGSPESIILESVLEGMAEYYSKNLARETRKGLLENAMSGKSAGGRPPYGYKVNPDTLLLEIDERTAPAVRYYFESIAAGLSLGKIAEELNMRGFRTYKGNRFNKNSFMGWAMNKKYKGVYTWDLTAKKRPDGKRNSHTKKNIEETVQLTGIVPAIISDELWEKANEMMNSRKHNSGRFRAQMTYLLSEKAYCGECGALLRGTSWEKNGERFAYYKCGANCGVKGVRKELLEEEVVRQIFGTVFTDESITEIINSIGNMYAEKRKGSPDRVLPIKKEIADLVRKIDNWLDAIGEGLADKQTVGQKIREATTRKSTLEMELSREMAIQAESVISEQAIKDELAKMKNQLSSPDEEARKLTVQQLVDKAIVTPDGDSFRVDLTVRLTGGVENTTPVISLHYELSFDISPVKQEM